MGGDVLTEHLHKHATEFLRALRLHRESGGAGSGGEESAQAARALRRAARRIGGALHTFRPLLDPEWSDVLRTELAWLSGTLGREHASAARLERLLGALHRLSGVAALPLEHTAGPVGAAVDATATALRTAAGRAGGAAARASAVSAAPRPATGGGPQGPPSAPLPSGTLTVGAAKAGALLERQLTLARTRAHSTALQALGSARFHAVADRVAVLASEVPLAPGAVGQDLAPLAAEAEARLAEAVAALPLQRAGHPYNAEGLMHGLAAEPAPQSQDAPWHHVRLLLRLHRYAREVLLGGPGEAAGGTAALRGVPRPGREAVQGRAVDRPGESGRYADEVTGLRLAEAGRALDRHRDAAEAAAAAAAAARTPRIAPATAYALGVLHADQRQEVEAARFAFQDIWLREAVGPR
ncbi:CHAD domain-containing protein [Streptomyces sulfonofaciens]|nr:CHAD domain-containing protein [Streptomyces sulfonofaciens]